MKIWILTAGLPLVLWISADCQTLTVPGLQQPVEVIRDQYGINHLYALNEHDLFFRKVTALPKIGSFNSKSGGDRRQAQLPRSSVQRN